MGIEPISGCLQGTLATLAHASPFVSRDAESSERSALHLALRSEDSASRLTHQSGRQESNLPRTAYQTVASPPGPRPDRKRPVRDSNPSRLLDRQVATPAASQGITNSKDGRIRTLCMRVGAAVLSQE